MIERAVEVSIETDGLYHIDNVPNVIATCVVLHNLCETLGDRCQSDWFTDDTSLSSQGTTATQPTASQPSSSTSATTAVLIRDAIRDSL